MPVQFIEFSNATSKLVAFVAEEIGNLANISGTASHEISDVLARSLQLVDQTIDNTKKELNEIMEQSRQKVEILRGRKDFKTTRSGITTGNG